MTDGELLQLAAKAAGIECLRWNVMLASYETSEGLWNALLNDGDALRLAVKLQIDLDLYDDQVWAGPDVDNLNHEFHREDPYAATRRAIVRAAAEIGRSM